MVSTSRSSPHTCLITGFVTRLTRQVSLVEQELLTILEHLSSPPVFSGVCVTRSLVLCVCFVDRCLSFCTFSFGHCVVCSDYPFGIFKLFLIVFLIWSNVKWLQFLYLCCIVIDQICFAINLRNKKNTNSLPMTGISYRNRNSVPFRSTWLHPWFLVWVNILI